MKENKKRGIFKPLGAFLLALVMVLTHVVGAMDVYAAIKEPTVNNISIGDKIVSGKIPMGYNQRNRKKIDVTIHVTVTRKAGGTEAKSTTIEHTTRSQNWTVNLDNALAEGDKVSVTQEYGGETSAPVVMDVTRTLNVIHKDNLQMPRGEIWIEQTNSNIVSEDEQAEAFELLKKANTDIAGDIKSVKFSIDGTSHAYFEVTYTDNSESGKIEAPNLTIKQVTEKSQAPNINKTYVADGQITITFDENIAAGTKIGIVQNFSEGEEKNFCEDGSCNVTKSTLTWVTVDTSTNTFTYNVGDDFLKLGQEFGVLVKEPHKLANCKKTEPEIKTPDRVKVRDPKSLTDAEKDAIRKAIREANTTTSGKSKMPDGTGFMNGQDAIIDFDKAGNVKIINPGNVEGDWVDGAFVPKKNEDGSIKIKSEDNVISIKAEDLVKNLAPDAPTFKESDGKKSIIITPNTLDTDAETVTVSYTGKDGKDKKTVAKKENGEWKITEGDGSVDANGVITLPADKVKGGKEVQATVTDKGGIADDDKTPLTSTEGTYTLKTKAKQVEELGGLDPVNMKKWVGDKVDWKDGVKAKDSAKEAEVKKLLEEAKTTFTDEGSRGTDKEGDFQGKIKVTFDDGSFIEVDQTLYVSNHVTSATRENLPDDALDVELKLGEGTKVDNTDGTEIEGDKENPTSYQKYKVKPGTNLKEYKLPTINTSVIDSIKLGAQDGYTEAEWKDSKNGTNFVVAADNNVFTATATKAFNVTFDPNGGSGTMDGATVKANENYTLPKNAFIPPNEDQEFSGWQIGDDTKNLKQPDTQIQITGDTIVKAIWNPIEFKVNFLPGQGASGTMEEKTFTKGSEFELPTPTFTAPAGKEFAGWKVSGQDGLKQVGDKITVSGTVTLTATWKAKGKPEDPTKPEEPSKPSDPKKPSAPAITWRGLWYLGEKTEPAKTVQEMEIGRHYKYLYGYVDKTVRPEGMITRSEAAALIARLANLDMTDKTKPNFKDTPSAWYNGAINAMVAKNLMFADKDGNFRPNEPITRGEFARALYYIDKKNDKVAPFADVKGHEFEDAINQAYGNGRIAGYQDGSFKPNANIQRAEAARILNQYADRSASLAGMANVKNDLVRFTDINESHWAYCEVMEAANSHEYQRAKGTLPETWLRILDK